MVTYPQWAAEVPSATGNARPAPWQVKITSPARFLPQAMGGRCQPSKTPSQVAASLAHAGEQDFDCAGQRAASPGPGPPARRAAVQRRTCGDAGAAGPCQLRGGGGRSEWWVGGRVGWRAEARQLDSASESN